MTEDEARCWIENRVSRETINKLEAFANLVLQASNQQNLIAASTAPFLWSRHIVDSAQLLGFAPSAGRWMDLGAGAGFPGIVVAIIAQRPVILAESRVKRIGFLREVVQALALERLVEVKGGRIQALPDDAFEVISARAYAPLDRLFATAHHLSSSETKWILPKGRSAKAELEAVRGSWQGSFRIVPSITDEDAAIILAEGIRKSRR